MRARAEVQAIYLREACKGRGAGFAMLVSGFGQMFERGFTSAYCWVLEGNATIRFYERTGAAFNGMSKEEKIGGKPVKELVYVWPDLIAFPKI
jgi:ribosomal protein S18 acetylase RimI-like enzyme